MAEVNGKTAPIDEKSGVELFRELWRVYPTAEVEDYYKAGTWKDDLMRTDFKLIQAHRNEGGAPEPPPLEEVPMPEMPRPQLKVPAMLSGGIKIMPVAQAVIGVRPPSVIAPTGARAVAAARARDQRVTALFAAKHLLEASKVRELLADLLPAVRRLVLVSFRSTGASTAASELEAFVKKRKEQSALEAAAAAAKSDAAATEPEGEPAETSEVPLPKEVEEQEEPASKPVAKEPVKPKEHVAKVVVKPKESMAKVVAPKHSAAMTVVPAKLLATVIAPKSGPKYINPTAKAALPPGPVTTPRPPGLVVGPKPTATEVAPKPVGMVVAPKTGAAASAAKPVIAATTAKLMVKEAMVKPKVVEAPAKLSTKEVAAKPRVKVVAAKLGLSEEPAKLEAAAKLAVAGAVAKAASKTSPTPEALVGAKASENGFVVPAKRPLEKAGVALESSKRPKLVPALVKPPFNKAVGLAKAGGPMVTAPPGVKPPPHLVRPEVKRSIVGRLAGWH